jgi:hypothetical protein
MADIDQPIDQPEVENTKLEEPEPVENDEKSQENSKADQESVKISIHKVIIHISYFTAFSMNFHYFPSIIYRILEVRI